MLISKIVQNIHGQSLLDIGCASGYLARLIKEKKNIQITGIDRESSELAKAKQYCDSIIEANLENPLPIEKTDFDIVLLADTLEHIQNADQLLSEIRRVTCASTNATVIISVPNVANLFVRLQLLFGNFHYSDRGILDRTHVKFYTKKSFFQFLNTHDMEIQKLFVTPIPLEEAFPRLKSFPEILTIVSTLLNIITQAWKSVFGYQFIVQATFV